MSPVQIDPRGRFDSYIDYMVNQFYLGTETTLPRLFSTPGFTEASANAAKDLQDLLIKPIQRDIKRTVESFVFAPVVKASGVDPAVAGVRLNWGAPESPEISIVDLIAMATAPAGGSALIRPEEFRKNAVKAGVELWDPKPTAASGNSTNDGAGR